MVNPLTLFLDSQPLFHNVGDWNIHYCDQGQGEVVVMLHGNPTWSYFYRHLIVTLRNNYRVIAYDHVGCGFSDRPPADSYAWTLAQRSADFEKFLAVLNVKEKITLVMHDWGVAIGCGYAVRYPERIARLIVCNGAAFPLPRTRTFPWQLQPFRHKVLGKLLVQDYNFFLHALLLTGTQKKIPPAIKAAYLAPYSSRADRHALWQFVADIPLTANDRSFATLTAIADNLHRLASLPMLLCWGKRDFIFDKSFLRQWCIHFPQAQLREYEHCGHLLLEDDPHRISRDVRDFMSGG